MVVCSQLAKAVSQQGSFHIPQIVSAVGYHKDMQLKSVATFNVFSDENSLYSLQRATGTRNPKTWVRPHCQHQQGTERSWLGHLDVPQM